MTSFNQFTFFHVDINQSEVENSFQPASDWIRSARKNVNKLKAVSLLGSLHAVRTYRIWRIFSKFCVCNCWASLYTGPVFQDRLWIEHWQLSLPFDLMTVSQYLPKKNKQLTTASPENWVFIQKDNERHHSFEVWWIAIAYKVFSENTPAVKPIYYTCFST